MAEHVPLVVGVLGVVFLDTSSSEKALQVLQDRNSAGGEKISQGHEIIRHVVENRNWLDSVLQRTFGKTLNEIALLAETNARSLSSLISDQQRDLVVTADKEATKTIDHVLDVVNSVRKQQAPVASSTAGGSFQ